MSEKKRLCIVFEESGHSGPLPGDGAEFKVYLEGGATLKGKTEDELSAAEFWAVKCFALVQQVLMRTDVVRKTSVQNPKDKE